MNLLSKAAVQDETHEHSLTVCLCRYTKIFIACYVVPTCKSEARLPVTRSDQRTCSDILASSAQKIRPDVVLRCSGGSKEPACA